MDLWHSRGGSTFAAIFPLWALAIERPSQVRFFPVDERVVPLNHPDSNWGMAMKLLLAPIGRAVDRANFAVSTDQYRQRLHEIFGDGVPVFDIVFLGVGDDGHTASLFPGGGWEDDRSSIVLATRSPKPPHERITLAPAVLTAARGLIVIIHGRAKAPAAAGILAGDMSLPVTRVLSMRSISQIFIHQPLFPRA